MGDFWAVTMTLFVIVPLLLIWLFTMVDLFARSDLGGLLKVFWLLTIILVPVLGTLAYLLVRPAQATYYWQGGERSSE